MVEILTQLQLLAKERVVSIRELQKNPTKVLQGIVRILKNGKSIGIFLDMETVTKLEKDLRALTSQKAQK